MPHDDSGWWRDRRAVAALEYSLIAALVACAIVGGVAALGGKISGLWLYGLTRFAAAMAAHP